MEEEDIIIVESSTRSTDSAIESEFSSGETFIKFPLPAHADESLCRDEFLKRLLPTTERVSERRNDSVVTDDLRLSSNFSIEGIAIVKMLQARKTLLPGISPMHEEDLTEDREKFFSWCLTEFQKASVEFSLVRLNKQLDTLLKIWPGEIQEIPHKLFYWTLEHFKNRSKVKQLYLKVLPKERTIHNLNCTKFCTDIIEIIRLVKLLKNDFFLNINICQSSLLAIQESNYTENKAWESDIIELRLKRIELKKTEMENRRSSNQGEILLAQKDANNVILSIEKRYHIGWLRSAGDQKIMVAKMKEQKLKNEVDELRKKINDDESAMGFENYVYQYQIDNYKDSISNWQDKLDADLESMELECNITRNHLIKAKDDLNFYKEQVDMFKTRVAEVLKLIDDEQNALNKPHKEHQQTKPKKKSEKKQKKK